MASQAGCLGAYMIGLDVDGPGLGRQIADACLEYGLDVVNITLLTPLPGTRLWTSMEKDERIIANASPDDWKCFTLSIPVARYLHLSRTDILDERASCLHSFYSYAQMARRPLAPVAYS